MLDGGSCSSSSPWTDGERAGYLVLIRVLDEGAM